MANNTISTEVYNPEIQIKRKDIFTMEDLNEYAISLDNISLSDNSLELVTKLTKEIENKSDNIDHSYEVNRGIMEGKILVYDMKSEDNGNEDELNFKFDENENESQAESSRSDFSHQESQIKKDQSNNSDKVIIQSKIELKQIDGGSNGSYQHSELSDQNDILSKHNSNLKRSKFISSESEVSSQNHINELAVHRSEISAEELNEADDNFKLQGVDCVEERELFNFRKNESEQEIESIHEESEGAHEININPETINNETRFNLEVTVDEEKLNFIENSLQDLDSKLKIFSENCKELVYNNLEILSEKSEDGFNIIDRDTAALIIQKNFKGWYVRNKHEKMSVSARKIQRWLRETKYNRYLAKSLLIKSDFCQQLHEIQLDYRAESIEVVIQTDTSIRSIITLSLENIKPRNKYSSFTKTIISIQALIRGFLVRVRKRNTIKKIIKIQNIMRMLQTRKIYNSILQAIIFIQQEYRKYRKTKISSVKKLVKL